MITAGAMTYILISVAIVLIWVAFWLLGQVVKTMVLADTYSVWSAIGVTGTALFGWLIFGHRLRPRLSELQTSRMTVRK